MAADDLLRDTCEVSQAHVKPDIVMKIKKSESIPRGPGRCLSSVDHPFVAVNIRKIPNARLLGNMGEKLPKQCMIITDQLVMLRILYADQALGALCFADTSYSLETLNAIVDR